MGFFFLISSEEIRYCLDAKVNRSVGRTSCNLIVAIGNMGLIFQDVESFCKRY